MLFREKSKVPQRLQDSFLQFSSTYFSKKKYMKSRKSEDSTFNTRNPKNGYFHSEMNKFIENTKNTEKFSKNFDDIQKRIITYQKKGNFFFLNNERIENNNDNKQVYTDFPSNYSKQNNLVTIAKKEFINSGEYFNKHFLVPDKKVNISEIDYEKIDKNTLNKSQTQLGILKDVVVKKKEFSNWKNEFKDVNKKFRVQKYGFKSGILGVDNPFNKFTVFYKEDYEKLKRKEEKFKFYDNIRKNQNFRLENLFCHY